MQDYELCVKVYRQKTVFTGRDANFHHLAVTSLTSGVGGCSCHARVMFIVHLATPVCVLTRAGDKLSQCLRFYNHGEGSY